MTLQTDYQHFLHNILNKIQLARYDMLQLVSKQIKFVPPQLHKFKIKKFHQK